MRSCVVGAMLYYIILFKYFFNIYFTADRVISGMDYDGYLVSLNPGAMGGAATHNSA